MAKQTEFSEKQKAFMAAVEASTQPAEKEGHRRLGSTTFELSGPGKSTMPLNGSEIYLDDIHVTKDELRMGNGIHALKHLTSLADQFGINIVTHPVPLKPESPSPYDLKQFYRKGGFEGARIMVYAAKSVIGGP